MIQNSKAPPVLFYKPNHFIVIVTVSSFYVFKSLHFHAKKTCVIGGWKRKEIIKKGEKK